MQDVFCELPCLTERSTSFAALELRKRFFPGAHKSFLAESLQKFIAYNRISFDFLEITPTLIGTDQHAALTFRTSRYIGAVPLRAPDTGKQIGDFVVSPRFVTQDRFADYIEILDLLGSNISPEIVDSLPLVSGRNFRPPFYLEAIKYVSSLEKVVQGRWRKFDSVEKTKSEPTGQVNWRKYVDYQSDPVRNLNFPVRTNVLSELHREYAQLRYVFDICSRELTSVTTPTRVKNAFRDRLAYLQNKLYFHKPKPTEAIPVRAFDTPAIKECKVQGNRILQNNLVQSTAWRVDFNDVFEKFVQHIFKELSRSVGGRVLVNPRIRSRSDKYLSWELRELEPDAIFQVGEFVAFVDAKYKSHMFNKFEPSDLLKEDFRRDLHQVLAYSSFTNERSKLGVLCYPSNHVETKVTQFRNPLNDASNQLLIVGIPLRRSVIDEAVLALRERFEAIGLGAENIQNAN